MRFVAGVVVGTLFGRTIVRVTTKVVPQSTRQKIGDKAFDTTSKFIARRVETALNFVDKKLYGETHDEKPMTYRRFRR